MKNEIIAIKVEIPHHHKKRRKYSENQDKSI